MGVVFDQELLRLFQFADVEPVILGHLVLEFPGDSCAAV